MRIFSVTNEELEDKADIVKAVMLGALVADGLIDKSAADEWAERHTVLHRKKSIFRTLSDKWSRDKTEASTYYFIVVSGTRYQ